MASISNLSQTQAGHCMKGRLCLKDIEESNRKKTKIDGHPLRMSQWLVKNLSQRQTDEFLKLPITQICSKFPFDNNWSFLQMVNELPHGPAWSCKKVTICSNREDENGELLQEEVEL
ncbi:uncharacterized protein F5147DRAFT_653786 [Suillus discolor]|uniref:Uncharacterized protein n=1 Tax=Suillus discolor TaxID=1912936 RepID=A0A9P7F5S1_9AGAM|nr:uncharacterized protein F5147DRAFT_653786 [Suillus discolor]KAG2106536.1 hypothetical protein F5147DRAFT_653786 [Suillus discolor]